MSMMQTPEEHVPFEPEVSKPRSKGWLIIGAILGGLVLVCGILFCVFVFSAGAWGGNVMSGTLSMMCQIYYSDLETTTCDDWGEDIWTNHLEEYSDCNDRAKTDSGQVDPDTLFACLEDKGLAPGD